MSKKRRIGLVLSGGGARGLAHLGVLKALEKFDIKPVIISGTSSGAVIGAFYAAGYPIDEIVDIISKNTIFHFGDFAWSKSGLLASAANEKMYRKYFKHKSFEDLKLPLYISATDILAGKTIYFSSGDVVKPMLASTAIPAIFEPVKYKNHLLIDGSALSGLPVEPLLKRCEVIIGSYVNPVNPIKNISGMLNIFDRGYHLTSYKDVKEKKEYCDLFLEPPALINYTMFDFKKAKEIIEIGYKYTIKQKGKIKLLCK